ncbi:ANTAR domain-containing protein [Lapillicoccus sp.]|uniref:ANTAR domain-containing protein n=1 Tax=Lapillicoccus sp. TaxID=1909287 RepID=UPI003982EB92
MNSQESTPSTGQLVLAAELSHRNAAHAALKIETAADHELGEHLQSALRVNRRIGVAIGLVMAQLGFTDEEAIQALRHSSMDANRKLVDVAEDIISASQAPRNVSHGWRLSAAR